MAAYLDDDFQGYAIGTNPPFGSFAGSGFFAQIVSEPGGTGIPGTDRSLQIILATVEFVNGAYLTQFTQFLSLYLTGPLTFNGWSYAISNGPGANGTFEILHLKVENDSTISLYQGGTLLANSGDKWFNFYSWNFLQINVTLSDVNVSGTDRVNIDFELAVNGVSVLVFNSTTPLATSVLANATAEANRFQMLGGRFGAFTLDTLQPIVSYPHAGSPKARVTQAALEVDALPDTAMVRVFQSALEVDALPDTAKVRIFQAVLEIDAILQGRWYISEG